MTDRYIEKLEEERRVLLEALEEIARWSTPYLDESEDQTEYGAIKRFARETIARSHNPNSPNA